MRRTVFTTCGKISTSCPRKWLCWQTTCITETEGGQETLRILKGYIQRISDEMSVLDKKDEDEE